MRKRRGAVPVGAALEVMNTEAGVVNTPPRARTRVVGQPCSHTEILKESLCSHTTGARTRVREGGKAPIRDRDAYFKAWRAAKFGGDFDPVSAAVDEAVRSPRRDAQNRGGVNMNSEGRQMAFATASAKASHRQVAIYGALSSGRRSLGG